MGIESVAAGDAGRVTASVKPGVELGLLYEVAKLRPAKVSLLRRIYESVMGKPVPPETIKVSGRIYGQVRKQLGVEPQQRSQDLTPEQKKALQGLLDAVMPVCHSRRKVFDTTQLHLQGRRAGPEFLGIVRARSSDELTGDLKTALRARLGESPKAEKQAGLLAHRIHAALVHQLALAQEGQRLLAAESAVTTAPPVVAVATPLDRQVALIRERIGQQLEISRQTTAQDLEDSKAALKGLAGDVEALAKAHGDLPPIVQLREQLRDAEDVLQVFEHRAADLGEIEKSSPTLHQALAALDPKPYVEARRGIRQICQTVLASESRVLQQLGQWIQSKEGVPIIQDIVQGKAQEIDGYFKGPLWDEDAYRLKSAALTAGDEKALRALDIQHQCRLAANELNRIMQSKVLDDPAMRKKVTLTAFTAMKADPALARFLKGQIRQAMDQSAGRGTLGALLGRVMRSEPKSAVNDVDLLMANWARLSLYDPETDSVPRQALEEFLKALDFKPEDMPRIERHVAQGFRSLAEVSACTEHMRRFADAICDDGLLKTLEETRSQKFRAQEITRVFLKGIGAPEDAAIHQAAVQSAVQAAVKREITQIGSSDSLEHFRLSAERRSIVDRIRNLTPRQSGQAAPDLAWLDSPSEVSAQKPYLNLVLKAIDLRKSLDDKSLPKDFSKDLPLKLAQTLKQLDGFNTGDLRHYSKGKSSVTVSDLLKIKDAAQAFTDLARKDAALQPVAARLALTKPQQDLVNQALKIAILQEGAAAADPTFTPSAASGAILKRLAGFGIDASSGQAPMTWVVRQLAERLTNDKRTMAQVCDDYAREAALDKVQLARASTKAARSLLLGDPQEKREETLRVVESAVRDLQPGQTRDIRFGAFGKLTVSAPVAMGAGANLETEARKHHGLTVSCDAQGRYSIEIHQGHQVRQGVSLSAVADLLSIGVDSSRTGREGHRFSVATVADCEDLAKALATGDPKALELCAATRVARTKQQGQAYGAGAGANLDLSVLTLGGQLRTAAGTSFERHATAEDVVEIYSAQREATASASAVLAADRGSAETVAGAQRSVTRTLHKQFGMLEGECGVVVSAKVFQGKLAASLATVLPASLALLSEVFAERIGGVEDGSEVFVTLRLDEDAMSQANEWLDQARTLLVHASATPGEAGAALKKQAQDLVDKAHALTQDSGNYIAEGVGWVSQETTEVSSSRGAYDYFASADARAVDGFLKFDAAVPMATAALAIP